MTNILEIELFRNLCDWDLDKDKYRDLHNDFACVGIVLARHSLHLKFQGLEKSARKLDVEFKDVVVVRMNIPLEEPLAELTLDNLHRGRVEINGGLVEADEKGRGYIYLQFYEDVELEFWSKAVSVTDSEVDS